MRAVTKIALATLLALPSLGCGALSRRAEYHDIYPINTLEAKTISKSGGGEVKEENEGKKKTSKEESETVQGVWLYRLVRNDFHSGDDVPRFARHNDDEGPHLKAIEVLFCPSREADISTCRIGVVWREDRHPMGRLVDRQGD